MISRTLKADIEAAKQQGEDLDWPSAAGRALLTQVEAEVGTINNSFNIYDHEGTEN